jgi:hypothetical protein
MQDETDHQGKQTLEAKIQHIPGPAVAKLQRTVDPIDADVERYDHGHQRDQIRFHETLPPPYNQERDRTDPQEEEPENRLPFSSAVHLNSPQSMKA